MSLHGAVAVALVELAEVEKQKEDYRLRPDAEIDIRHESGSWMVSMDDRMYVVELSEAHGSVDAMTYVGRTRNDYEYDSDDPDIIAEELLEALFGVEED